MGKKKHPDRQRGYTRDNRRVYVITVVSILLLSFAVFGTTFYLSVFRVVTRTEDLVTSNVSSAAEGIGTLFTHYRESLENLIPNASVQRFLLESDGSWQYADTRSAARDSIMLTNRMISDSNYIGLYKNERESIYGGSNITSSGFTNTFEKDYAESILWGFGDFRASYTSNYFKGDVCTLTVYQPVYDMSHVGKTIGTLCVNVPSRSLSALCKDYAVGSSSLTFSITDREGNIFYNSDSAALNGKCPIRMNTASGGTTKNRIYYSWCKIPGSDMYVVGNIYNREIIYSSLVSFVFILFGFIAAIIVILVINRWSTYRMNEPMKQLVNYMNTVADGDLSVRVDENAYGEDFYMVGHGFNQMLLRMEDLMGQVRSEETQIAEIRLNKLQAQIKPHFLYNVLDCIHWQALANEDYEVSDMVKALAVYYRLSLSGGKDVVELKEETECVRNYVVLMNLRYDQILVFHDRIDEKYRGVMIPKVSLQPLVENAIYHGVKERRDGVQGELLLTAREENTDVIISVEDNGVGMSDEALRVMNEKIQNFEGDYGYGVRNVNHRIKLLCGEGYGLFYRRNEMGGVTVDIRLPGKSAALRKH